MNCKNCGEAVPAKFCSHCGQNLNVAKITLSSLSNDLSESVFQINKGFLHTLKELFVRPAIIPIIN